MSRLTNQQYLACRARLHTIWQTGRIAYSVATVPRQWELHRYYQTQVDAPDDVLIANRQVLTTADPSLPNRAGKTYAAVVHEYAYRAAHAPVVVSAGSGSRKERTIMVRAVARPKPDLAKLANALLQVAEQMRQHNEQEVDQSDEAA